MKSQPADLTTEVSKRVPSCKPSNCRGFLRFVHSNLAEWLNGPGWWRAASVSGWTRCTQVELRPALLHNWGSASSTTATIKQPAWAQKQAWRLQTRLQNRTHAPLPKSKPAPVTVRTQRGATSPAVKPRRRFLTTCSPEWVFCPFGLQVESVFVIFSGSDKQPSVLVSGPDLKDFWAWFLPPRSAKQPVDVCCISIKHSLFQRYTCTCVCVSGMETQLNRTPHPTLKQRPLPLVSFPFGTVHSSK